MVEVFLTVAYTAFSEWRSWRQGRHLSELGAHLAIERSFSLMREFCFYYASLMSRGINEPSFPVRQQILNHIRELYGDVAKLRQEDTGLKEDPWYNVEKRWAPTIGDCITKHNQDTPDYTVEPLPSP